MGVESAPVTESTLRVPIAETLARVSSVDRYLAATLYPSEGEGWVLTSDVARPGSPSLGRELERLVGQYDTRDRKAIASSLLMQYTWYVAGAAIASYLLERRVPDISAANLALRLSGDEEPRAAFLSSRFATLPNDANAAQVSTLVVADESELLLWLRQRLVDHLSPLVAELRAWSRLSTRALRGIAADRCGDIFLWAGKAVGAQRSARYEAERFLTAHAAPWHDSPRFFERQHAGRQHVFFDRSVCCLTYKLPAGRHCGTCPLLSMPEREERLRETMSRGTVV